MGTRPVISALIAVGIISFVPHVSDDTPELSHEQAKAALIDLLRSQPGAFAVKFDPEEYATKPLQDQGGGKYRLGWIRIDVPNTSFDLGLLGNDHAVEYRGEFRFADGRWLARTTRKSFACKFEK